MIVIQRNISDKWIIRMSEKEKPEKEKSDAEKPEDDTWRQILLRQMSIDDKGKKDEKVKKGHVTRVQFKHLILRFVGMILWSNVHNTLTVVLSWVAKTHKGVTKLSQGCRQMLDFLIFVFLAKLFKNSTVYLNGASEYKFTKVRLPCQIFLG